MSWYLKLDRKLDGGAFKVKAYIRILSTAATTKQYITLKSFRPTLNRNDNKNVLLHPKSSVKSILDLCALMVAKL